MNKCLVLKLPLVFPAIVLMGCSDSKNKDPFANMDPYSAPASAASKADSMMYLQKLNIEDNEDIPSSRAIFDWVISGDSEISYIHESSPERQEALAKLNSQGQRYRENIRTNCTINNATKSTSGKLEKQGDARVSSLKQSTDGGNCPLVTSQTEVAATQINRLDERSRTGEFSRNVKENSSTQVVNVDMQRDSEIKLLVRNMETNLKFLVSESTQDNNITILGQVELRFTNGDTLSGTVRGTAKQTNETSSARLIIDLKGKKGAVKVGVVSESGKTETYLNGEKFSDEVMTRTNAQIMRFKFINPQFLNTLFKN